MPIGRDEYGCVVLEFGTGDIGVANATAEGDGRPTELIFHPGEVGEVGRPNDDCTGQTTAEIGAAVRMAFRNRASCRVVIEELEKLYQGLPEPADPK